MEASELRASAEASEMAAEGARRALTWKKHEGSPRGLGRASDRAGRTSKGAARALKWLERPRRGGMEPKMKMEKKPL